MKKKNFLKKNLFLFLFFLNFSVCGCESDEVSSRTQSVSENKIQHNNESEINTTVMNSSENNKKNLIWTITIKLDFLNKNNKTNDNNYLINKKNNSENMKKKIYINNITNFIFPSKINLNITKNNEVKILVFNIEECGNINNMNKMINKNNQNYNCYKTNDSSGSFVLHEKKNLSRNKSKNKKWKVFYTGSFLFKKTLYEILPFLGSNKNNYDNFTIINDNTTNNLYNNNNLEKTKIIKINNTNHILKENENNMEDENKSLASDAIMPDQRNISYESQNINNETTISKQRRGKQKITIQVLAVVDFSLYKKWLTYTKKNVQMAVENINYYFIHIFNGIKDRYEKIDCREYFFTIELLAIYIAQEKEKAGFSEWKGIKVTENKIDSAKSLSALQKWVELQKEKSYGEGESGRGTSGRGRRPGRRSRNEGGVLSKQYDVVVAFTDYQMSTSLGKAYIGTSCSNLKGCICRDLGFYFTIHIAAHEIGHVMGSNHDMMGRCPYNDQFIMAGSKLHDLQTYNQNELLFSPCSIEAFRKHLKKLNEINQNCHLDSTLNIRPNQPHPSPPHLHPHHPSQPRPPPPPNLHLLPGQIFSPDQQCKISYGPNSFHCAGGGNEAMFCYALDCYDPEFRYCVKINGLRPARGTSCGNRKWCLHGKCVSDKRAPSFKDFCLYGDYKLGIEVEERRERERRKYRESTRKKCKDLVRNDHRYCKHQHYRSLCCESCSNKKN